MVFFCGKSIEALILIDGYHLAISRECYIICAIIYVRVLGLTEHDTQCIIISTAHIVCHRGRKLGIKGISAHNVLSLNAAIFHPGFDLSTLRYSVEDYGAYSQYRISSIQYIVKISHRCSDADVNRSAGRVLTLQRQDFRLGQYCVARLTCFCLRAAQFSFGIDRALSTQSQGYRCCIWSPGYIVKAIEQVRLRRQNTQADVLHGSICARYRIEHNVTNGIGNVVCFVNHAGGTESILVCPGGDDAGTVHFELSCIEYSVSWARDVRTTGIFQIPDFKCAFRSRKYRDTYVYGRRMIAVFGTEDRIRHGGYQTEGPADLFAVHPSGFGGNHLQSVFLWFSQGRRTHYDRRTVRGRR